MGLVHFHRFLEILLNYAIMTWDTADQHHVLGIVHQDLRKLHLDAITAVTQSGVCMAYHTHVQSIQEMLPLPITSRLPASAMQDSTGTEAGAPHGKTIQLIHSSNPLLTGQASTVIPALLAPTKQAQESPCPASVSTAYLARTRQG